MFKFKTNFQLIIVVILLFIVGVWTLNRLDKVRLSQDRQACSEKSLSTMRNLESVDTVKELKEGYSFLYDKCMHEKGL